MIALSGTLIYKLAMISGSLASDAVLAPWRSPTVITFRFAACLAGAISIALITTLFCGIFKLLTLEQIFLRVQVGVSLAIALSVIMIAVGVLLDDLGKFQQVEWLYNHSVTIALALVAITMIVFTGLDLTCSETTTKRTIIEFEFDTVYQDGDEGEEREGDEHTGREDEGGFWARPGWENIPFFGSIVGIDEVQNHPPSPPTAEQGGVITGKQPLTHSTNSTVASWECDRNERREGGGSSDGHFRDDHSGDDFAEPRAQNLHGATTP